MSRGWKAVVQTLISNLISFNVFFLICLLLCLISFSRIVQVLVSCHYWYNCKKYLFWKVNVLNKKVYYLKTLQRVSLFGNWPGALPHRYSKWTQAQVSSLKHKYFFWIVTTFLLFSLFSFFFSSSWIARVLSCSHALSLFLMHPFSTPWKHQKTLRFSDVFRG